MYRSEITLELIRCIECMYTRMMCCTMIPARRPASILMTMIFNKLLRVWIKIALEIFTRNLEVRSDVNS